MKRILLLLFVVISFAAQSQITRNQSYDWRNLQIFSDIVRMDSLTGSGSILKITEGGVLYRGSGTQDTLIDISQVLGLQDSLASRQKSLTLDSNFVFQGDTFIQLNDTIWVNVGTFYSEVKVSSTEPKLFLNETDASSNSRLFGISSNGGATNIGFYSDVYSAGAANITLNRSGRNMTSMHLNNTSGTSVVKLKNTGVGIFSDTLQAGKLKGAGILYPTSDGTSGQVLTTNGSGVATFQDASPTYVAGTNITISNDTISATSSGDGDWTINGNYIYNLSDSIGIGTATPAYPFDVRSLANFQGSGNVMRVTTTAGTGINLTSGSFGSVFSINGATIDSVSQREVVNGVGRFNELVSEYTLKSHVDTFIQKRSRVSWAADVDTSARIDGFVLKWDNGTKKHYYDTAGTGGGTSYWSLQGDTLIRPATLSKRVVAGSLAKYIVTNGDVPQFTVSSSSAPVTLQLLSSLDADMSVQFKFSDALQDFLLTSQNSVGFYDTLQYFDLSTKKVNYYDTLTLNSGIKWNYTNDSNNAVTRYLGFDETTNKVVLSRINNPDTTGGSTYFRGQGLTLSANTFAIGDDSVTTAMLQDDAVTYSKIQNVGGNSVLARAASGSGNLSEVSLGTSQLLGRGSSGNIAPISLSGLTMVGTTLTNSNTGTVTNIAAGNGMDFSSITTTGTVTMGTPTTLTGSSTNATTSTSHTHALDFGTFKSNSYGFFLDTARMEERDSAVTITTEEKVILFTMSENIDSVLLGSGYFTMSARVVINAVNNDTLSGAATVTPLPRYTIKAYLVDDVQTLGSGITGSKTELRTARVIDMFTALKNGESTAEGILTMTMNTNPTKFRMKGGFFVAVTISATYGGVTDYVKHEDASMVIEKANDYDENIEQIFD